MGLSRYKAAKRAPVERQLYPFHAWKNARHLVVIGDFQAELYVGKHYVGRASYDEGEDLRPSRTLKDQASAISIWPG